MQCLDFLEQVMESGIYSVGLKMAIWVSSICHVKTQCFQNMWKSSTCLPKKTYPWNVKTLSCHQRFEIYGEIYGEFMDLSIVSISSHCNMVPISHCIKKKKKKEISKCIKKNQNKLYSWKNYGRYFVVFEKNQ